MGESLVQLQNLKGLITRDKDKRCFKTWDFHQNGFNTPSGCLSEYSIVHLFRYISKTTTLKCGLKNTPELQLWHFKYGIKFERDSS